MVKASSLASTITLVEITEVADRIQSRHAAPIEIFIVAGAIYLTINYLVTELVRWAEWRLTPYARPPEDLGQRLTLVEVARARPTLIVLSALFAAGLVTGWMQ